VEVDSAVPWLPVWSSEMIVTKELRDVVKIGLRDINYDIGPFVTLIDNRWIFFFFPMGREIEITSWSGTQCRQNRHQPYRQY